MNAHQDKESGITRVFLQDATAFEQALERYIDENKPDPLQVNQIKSWVLEWKDDHENDTNGSSFFGNSKHDINKDDTTCIDCDDDNELAVFSSAPSFTPTHVLSGRLTIQGEYVCVTLHSACWWNQTSDTTRESKNDTQGDGNSGSSLVYQCKVSANLLSTPRQQQDDEQQHQTSKTKMKLHKQMIQRLSADDYIAKLLPLNNKKHDMATVCQAQIFQQPSSHNASAGRLEERVDCTQDVAEGIRRAIFSTADSTLDVFDLLLRLPSLPQTTSTTAGASNSSSFTTTRLADRARLRLLEDAMCDACEQEGEDELVQDLDLADHSNQNVSTTRKHHPLPKRSRTDGATSRRGCGKT